MSDSNKFNGRLSITVEMDCEDADLAVIEDAMKRAIEARAETQLQVTNYTVHSEHYTS